MCEHIAGGLRTALLLRAVDEAPAGHAPGMILLGPNDEVVSLSDAAQLLLEELPPEELASNIWKTATYVSCRRPPFIKSWWRSASPQS